MPPATHIFFHALYRRWERAKGESVSAKKCKLNLVRLIPFCLHQSLEQVRWKEYDQKE
jgi:hypothetical protein